STVVGAGRAVSTSSSPLPASMVAVPPMPTSSRSASSRASSSPKGRLDAAMMSRRLGSNGIDCAASTTVAPFRREPSASTVPSPPSASGNCVHSTPACAKPSASAAAAARAERTALRLAGHASACNLVIPALLCVGLLLAHLRLVCRRHHLQHREREALTREEQEPDTDPDRGLDRLEAEAVCDAVRVRDAVALQWCRNCDLCEPDVARPEREDRRDVHQQQHDARGGQRRVNVERAHRCPDCEELAHPPRDLEQDRKRG